MSDSFTETTSTSWFTRIKNALSGIVVGFLLVITAVALLFWNEGRAVKTATALAEGAGLVVTVDPDNPPTDSSGKLVHFSGQLVPTGVPEDGVFTGVTAPQGTLRLVRRVEMYQWAESSKIKTVKKFGGGEEKTKIYSYAKKWSDRKIDSSSFKIQAGHENPDMPINSQTFSVDSGSVGKVTLAGADFSHLGKEQPVTPDEQLRTIVQGRFGDGRIAVIAGNNIEVRSNTSSGVVGDLRVSFATGDVDVISVIGKYDNNTISPFTTSNGRNISMFREGTADAKLMFDDAISSNTMWTWATRFGGFLVMMLGFNMIFSIVGVLGDVVPFIGDVFRFATGMAAFALASVLSTLIIGLAWVYFRPVIGISIIVIGLVLAGAALYLGKSKALKRKLNDSATQSA